MRTASRVQAVIDRFVNELSVIAREEAASLLLQGLNGRATKSTRSDGYRAKGAKRPAHDLEAMQTKALGYIQSHPGERIEQINAALGTSTKELALPIKKLIASKAIRTEGQRRATKYFAGGARKANASKKRAKKR